MKTWTGTYESDGEQLTEAVEAEDLFAATTAFSAIIPEGGSFVSIALVADDVIASAAAKLVDLGLTPDEAAAVVGDPVSGN